MDLTKEQTLNLLYKINKRKSVSSRFKFSTKFKWKCLGCMKTIYIPYDSCGRQAIFCYECFSKVQLKPTVAQYQYMRILKEKQKTFVDNYVNDFIDND